MPYYRAVLQAASTPPRIGVLLVNTGAPESPGYFPVQRFLRDFLSDHRVVDAWRPVWLPILYGAVLPIMPLSVARKYRRIWLPDGSPMAVYSKRLASGIEDRLHAPLGDVVCVELAMTYGDASIPSAIQSLAERNAKRLLILPLYPQYCSSTTGAVFDRAVRALERWRWLPETRFVNGYCTEAGFIEAQAARILHHWDQAGERSHLVFSYHGIPANSVKHGDPYRTQAEATTRLVASRLGLREEDWSHCYRSPFGAARRLEPGTEATLRDLARRGVRKLDVVSPSSAVDCRETLYQVGIEYRDKFIAWGGESLGLIPALNDDERHAQALASVIRSHLKGWIK